MNPSGPPRYNQYDEFDLNSGTEVDASSRLNIYRAGDVSNLNYGEELDGLSFGGLSVSNLRTENLRNLNIVSSGPPLPQELRSNSGQNSLLSHQDPYEEPRHRPLSMGNLRGPVPPGLLSESQKYQPQSISMNNSPRVPMQYSSPALGQHLPPSLQSPSLLQQSPSLHSQSPVDGSRYGLPYPRPSYAGEIPPALSGSGRYNIQLPEDFPSYTHVFQPRGPGPSYHVSTPPMQYSPPPMYAQAPPQFNPNMNYRQTPRFVPPLVENHNLHYRPNREQQIANLAKAKLSGSTTTSTDTSPTNSSKESPPVTVKGMSPPLESRKTTPEKKEVAVYTVKFKISTTYCVLASVPNLPAISINEHVVIAVTEGEDVGVVTSIQSLKYFMEQFNLHNEEETLMQMKCIVRVASEKEKKDVKDNNIEEAKLVELISERNKESYQLPITIIDIEYQVDRKKFTIYYDTLEPGAKVDMQDFLKGMYHLVQTKVACKRISKPANRMVGNGNSFKG